MEWERRKGVEWGNLNEGGMMISHNKAHYFIS